MPMSYSDIYSVHQVNVLDHANTNESWVTQFGKYNDAYGFQKLDSDYNDQYNDSVIDNLGGSAAGGDIYQVGQANVNVGFNLNYSNLLQVGKYNDAVVVQDIDSGHNDQHNDSSILDIGGSKSGYHGHHSGGSGYDDADAYHIGQANVMSSHNFNYSNVGQHGKYNDALVVQDIDSGNNSQSNSSEIFDFA